MNAQRPLMVIFDRDGVLNVDHGYAYEPSKLEWVPGAMAAVKRANDAGAVVVIATNQSGIGRGYYSEADMEAFHAEMLRQLSVIGARIDGVPDRKPNPGMILRAIADHGIDPAQEPS
jgi:D-glycero-D-manno-heptose 1,7-bisphosphate phosphatase